MSKKQPISIAAPAAQPEPIFLSALDLARLNATYFELELAKANAQSASQRVEEAKEQFNAQVASTQRTVNVDFPGWDRKTGQVYLNPADPLAANKAKTTKEEEKAS